MNITEKNVIGELVALDYRTAEVFSKYKIDFCCKGNQTIAEVCDKKKIDRESLLSDLNAISSELTSASDSYNSWPLDLLADYIEKKHHRYVVEKTEVIKKYLTKVSSVHGPAHPELYDIHREFFDCAGALAAHMQKEELILFPFIRKMVTSNGKWTTPHFGTVENPIAMMKHEHELEGERFEKIAALSNNYTPPADACNTYRVTYALLKEFEQDLHLHIHLENNILFPKAVKMEAELSAETCQI